MLPDRFWSKMHVQVPSGCWVWTGGVGSHGYGAFAVGRSMKLAHRLAYEDRRGPIPAGQTIDHLCGNKLCCNAEHLEVVSLGENVRRAKAFTRATAASAAERRARTHCKSGHEFTEANTYRYGTTRQCLTCKRAAKARFEAKRRAA